MGDVRRISPEAPVPVVHVESVSRRLGGAANVVQNLQKLGIKPLLISVCGKDENGKNLISILEEQRCCSEGIHISAYRPTTIKTRIVARNQQVVRADRELVEDLNEQERDISGPDLRNFERSSGVIISDYGKGVISQPLIKHILEKCITNRSL